MSACARAVVRNDSFRTFLRNATTESVRPPIPRTTPRADLRHRTDVRWAGRPKSKAMRDIKCERKVSGHIPLAAAWTNPRRCIFDDIAICVIPPKSQRYAQPQKETRNVLLPDQAILMLRGPILRRSNRS